MNTLKLTTEIVNLNKEMNRLLEYLLDIETKYNSLSNQNIKTPEEWLYGLPIDSLKDLDLTSPIRTRLGDAKERTKLKKESTKIVKEIESIEHRIKIAKLDLAIAEINYGLQKLGKNGQI